jgi:hypothetical protein
MSLSGAGSPPSSKITFLSSISAKKNECDIRNFDRKIGGACYKK